MSEQAGSSPDAIAARRALLGRQYEAIVEADRALADALASAHAAMRDSIRRLDEVAADIERAVSDQAELAVDTPVGGREFQRFLLDKQREITAIVADARELDRTKSAVLARLLAQYAGPAGSLNTGEPR
ncbi:DUF4226 domain-containing protein [Mycobacterium pseudokansasii]|uniref:DUF4226 domain-containing protein n=1 Tax=Mycobacterium pseudokansasii TaxID=2341080 RepID=UPI0007B51B32|nr:DUF4226 domain-containing protein [Mycobacterium pseudokansasii]KZS65756.1 hypothetical protein A4G27_14325 [Mycobacterium kansasii]VAZ87288.1 hypothetical protein LAUMK35_00186 [Mycobacterium pseudokansasii]VAZ87707.1 hypothetical protein LAUMK21_00184 [Mycobacterium pseudokansasii]